MKARRLIGAVVGTCALVATVTACTQSPAAPANTLGGLVSMKVGIVPVADLFPLYIAQDKGLFKDAGLSVDISSAGSNAAAVVPSVLNGEFQIGASATPPFLNAVQKNIPITGVSPAGAVQPDPNQDNASIVVTKGSPITGPKQLEGKKVATNALGSLVQVAGAALTNQSGGDASKIDWVVMPFPDMAGALQQGRVDAILTVEPFLTAATQNPALQSIAPLYSNTYPAGTTEVLYFASKQYFATNRDAVQKFVAVMARANQMAADNPQLIRDALVTYGNFKPDVAQAVKLPLYPTQFNVDGMQRIADGMVKDGFLDKPIDVQSALLK